MLEKIFGSIINFQITPAGFFICLLTSLALGFGIAFVFMFRNIYTKSFVMTLVVVPAVVSLLIMIINGNIGTGVAVAGAFSLVRFRSAQGSAREIAFIFMATAVGIAIGTGYVGVAVIFTLVLLGVILLIGLTRFGEAKSTERDLRITIPESLDYTHVFEDLFEKYTLRADLTKVRTTNMGSLYRLYYHVVISDITREKDFIDELRTRNGNLDIICSRTMENMEEGL